MAYVRATSHRAGASECMVSPVAGSVRVQVDGITGRAHVSGLKRCRSPWACPTCAPCIRQRRAAELTELCERARAMGHTALLVTYTLPHVVDESLDDVFGDLSAAWRKMWSGRWAADFKADLGIVGSVRAVEITRGPSGWHPHLHVLMFVDQAEPAVDAGLVAIWISLFRRWATSVEAVCGRRPSARNGLDVQIVTDPEAVGEYVADGTGWSVGAELTAGPVKITKSTASLTPFAILGAAAVWGCADAGRLWAEYERSTAGRHAIQASPGLYAFYEVTEATDEDAAAPEAHTVVASVEVDILDWVLMAELHVTDRFVMAVEDWAALGAGPPPDGRAFLLEVLAERRRFELGHR